MRIRRFLVVAAVMSLAAVPAQATAGRGPDHDHGPTCARTVLHVLDPSTHGNPEGVAWHAKSRSFFVGATRDGTIYRGRLHRKKVRPFVTVDPAAGRSAVGMEAVGSKLYVAGGATGKLFVYRIRTGALVGTFDTGPGGFLNDLAVTERGHVFVTDSYRPTLWQVTRKQIRAGTGTPVGVDVSPEISYVPGAFNLNGIEAADERTFLAVQSATGLLYRIILDPSVPSGRTVTQVVAPPVTRADGITWDRGRLIIVSNTPEGALTFLALKSDLSEGVVTNVRTDPALLGPSTVARAHHRYLVVNADFSSSTTPFTVASLKAPRSHPVTEIPDDGDEWLFDALKMRH